MTSHELYVTYQRALYSVRQLRQRAGYHDSELKDSWELRADARRFARRLAYAPDTATAEIDLLGDHAGAQAFWSLLSANWETMELLLLPSAFELMPNPLPYEVLSLCFLSMLETSVPEVFEEMEVLGGDHPGGSFQEFGGGGYDSLALSPLVGRGKAGAVWEFADVY